MISSHNTPLTETSPSLANEDIDVPERRADVGAPAIEETPSVGSSTGRKHVVGTPFPPTDPYPPPPSTRRRDYSTIPEDLKRRHQWVGWKLESPPSRDKPTKVLYSLATNTKASSTDSLTWGAYKEAIATFEAGGYDGIGFVLSSGDPYVFIDLDDAIDPAVAQRARELGLTGLGEGFKPWARPVIEQLAPYAYIALSQSGTGAHVLTQGKLPGAGGKRPAMVDGVQVGSIEMYDQERFVALTGRTLASGFLTPVQPAVNHLYRRFGFGRAGDDDRGAGWGEGAYDGLEWSTGLSDDEVLTKARSAKNGREFSALFDRGDVNAYDGDHSRADAALVTMLAFYTGPHPDQIDRLVRRSKLYRPKWDEQRGVCTYGERTMGYVLRERGSHRTDYWGKRSDQIAHASSGGSLNSSASSAFSAPTGGGDAGLAPRLPIEVFPPVSREFIEQGAAAIGVPPEMIAIPFLVNAGAAIGNTRRVELKPGYEQPANLFAAVIAKPGSAKTPSSDYARTPLDRLQQEAHGVFRDRYQAWQIELAAAKKAREPRLPREPVEEQFYTTNATTEAIATMVEHSPGLVVSTDELVGPVKAFDAYRKGADRQFYLSLWAGTAIKVDRKTAPTIFVPRPVVGVFGTIQPDLLPSLADVANRHDGFIDRFLMAMPEVGFAPWTEDIIDQKPIADMTKVFRRLRRPTGYLGPIVLPLSPDARAVFRDWYAENGRIVEASSGLAAGSAAKLPNQCARLALLIHLLAEPDDLSGPIGADTVRDAITLVEYFRASLGRILPTFSATAPAMTAGLVPRLERVLAEADGAWLDRTTISAVLSGHVVSNDITSALETLRAEDVAEVRTITTGGRPREEWRLKDTPAGNAKKAEEVPSGAEAIAAEPVSPWGIPGQVPQSLTPLEES